MSAKEEDNLRLEVSNFIKDNKPISWCFLHKSLNQDEKPYTSCQGGFSDEDAFLFVKHIFKERPDVMIAALQWGVVKLNPA